MECLEVAVKLSRMCRVFLAASLAIGCQTTSRKPAYSDNPLLASRQPLVHTAAEREKAAAAAHPNAKPNPDASANGAPVLPPPVPLGTSPSAIVKSPGNGPPPP